MDAELALFTARPTTLYGIAALLLHVTTATDDGEEGETIYEYARGWQNLPELEDAVANFHQRVAGASRNIIERGAA
jgi:hypothetical protein